VSTASEFPGSSGRRAGRPEREQSLHRRAASLRRKELRRIDSSGQEETVAAWGKAFHRRWCAAHPFGLPSESARKQEASHPRAEGHFGAIALGSKGSRPNPSHEGCQRKAAALEKTTQPCQARAKRRRPGVSRGSDENWATLARGRRDLEVSLARVVAVDRPADPLLRRRDRSGGCRRCRHQGGSHAEPAPWIEIVHLMTIETMLHAR
jgi:hypothetical protein